MEQVLCSIITTTFTGLLNIGNTHLRCSKRWHYYAGGVLYDDYNFDKIKEILHWVGQTSKNLRISRVIPLIMLPAICIIINIFYVLVFLFYFSNIMTPVQKYFIFSKPVLERYARGKIWSSYNNDNFYRFTKYWKHASACLHNDG